MTLSAIDPTPALIVVDLQKGIVGYPTIHPIDAILERTASLARAFRAAGFPVVLVNATGGAPGRTEQQRRDRPAPAADFAEFADELDRQPSDHVVSMKTWGAFTTDGVARISDDDAAGNVTHRIPCQRGRPGKPLRFQRLPCRAAAHPISPTSSYVRAHNGTRESRIVRTPS